MCYFAGDDRSPNVSLCEVVHLHFKVAGIHFETQNMLDTTTESPGLAGVTWKVTPTSSDSTHGFETSIDGNFYSDQVLVNV